ncbi:SPP1 phage holin family protein [Macrococcus armenti]|uniref:phage holin n=1 Tax=Macrococcus armenti TaxID=2875764 RepID=UPI001CCCF3C3|nr:phage holin [Macrococcus armenti]UBH21862.1 SPP1 phage holin family protein [Macrococcus armenti]
MDNNEVIIGGAIDNEEISQETTTYEQDIVKEVEAEAVTDFIKQIAYMIVSLIPVLAGFGFSYDWLNEDTVTQVSTAIITIVSAIITLIGIYKNHFSGKNAKAQKIALKKNGLK